MYYNRIRYDLLLTVMKNIFIAFFSCQLIKPNKMKKYIPNDEWKCSFFEELTLDSKSIVFRKEIGSPAQNYSRIQIDAFEKKAYANKFERLIKNSEKHILLIDFFKDRLHFKTGEDYEDKVFELNADYISNLSICII